MLAHHTLALPRAHPSHAPTSHDTPQLSRLEGKPGTAERPLSDLGAVSFRSYWQRAVLDCLRDNQKGDISIQVGAGGWGWPRARCRGRAVASVVS